MQLNPRAREWYTLEITTTPTVSATWEASFDGGTTWVPADTGGTYPRWLVAGPFADPTGASVVRGARTVPKVRAVATPEVIVRDAPGITLA